MFRPSHDPSVFSAHRALVLAEACRDTYGSHEAFVDKWSHLGSVRSWECGATVARGWVTKDHTVICFRGTDDFTDWKRNTSMGRTTLEDYRQVHSGFLAAVREIAPVLEQDPDIQTSAWLAGHSLGGAIAAITSALVNLPYADVEAVYSFGAPRVGDGRWRDMFLDPHFRVVNAGDIVPSTPPWLLGYTHQGTRRVVTHKGLVKRRQSLWDWISGRIEPGLAHDIDSYVSRLRKHCDPR